MSDEIQHIVGLDLSIGSTGYCKCRADLPTFTITALGSIKTKLRDEHTKDGKKVVTYEYSLQERIHTTLTRLTELGIQQPDTVLVGIENYAFTARGDSATKLAELQGVVRYFLWLAKRPKILVSTATVKAHVVTGEPTKTKNLIPMYVAQRYGNAILAFGQEITDDDQADAIVICELAWLYYRWSHNLPFDVELTKKLLGRLENFQKADT